MFNFLQVYVFKRFFVGNVDDDVCLVMVCRMYIIEPAKSTYTNLDIAVKTLITTAVYIQNTE